MATRKDKKHKRRTTQTKNRKKTASKTTVKRAPKRTKNTSKNRTGDGEVASMSQGNIRFTSSLVEDYRDDMSKFDNYRTIVTFPVGTKTVDLWAEEETEVSIYGETYTLDAVKAVRVKPNQLNKITIDIEASALAVSPLILKTDAMENDQRFFVFPDMDAHRKLGKKTVADFNKNRKSLGISSKYKKKDCEHVGQAVVNLSQTIQYSYDPAEGGFGKYESIKPEKMDDAHWMVDFSGDGPSYRTLTAEEAEAAQKNAVVHREPLAQGWRKRLKKNMKKAEKVTVSTAKKAEKSTSKTTQKATKSADKAAKSASKTADKAAKSAGKTADKTVKSASKTADKAAKSATKTAKATKKALKHGGVLDSMDGLSKSVSKLGADAVGGAKDLTKTLRKKATKALVITLEVAGEEIMFLVDKAKHIGQVIEGILEKVGASVMKLIKWIVDLFDWGDVLHTQNVLEEGANHALKYVASSAKSAKKEVSGFIDTIRNAVGLSVDNGGKTNGDRPGAQKTEDDKKQKSSGPMEKVDWLLNKLLAGANFIPKFPQLEGVDTGPLTAAFKEFDKALHSDPEVNAALKTAYDKLKKAFSQPQKAPQLILGAVLELLKAALEVSLTLIEMVVGIMLDLAAALVKLLRKILNMKLPIPFLNNLFKLISGGKPLTILRFLTLLIAIPVTLVCKVFAGEAPFKGHGAAAQGKKLNRRIRDWGIVYSVCMFVNGALMVVDDAMSIDDVNNDPASLFLNIAGLFVGAMAQVAGFPVGHPSFTGWSWSTVGARLANSIWLFQWYMWLGSLVFLIQGNTAYKDDDDFDDFVTVWSAVMEVIHLALFSWLVGGKHLKNDKLAACAIIDPLPGIMHVVYESHLKQQVGVKVLGGVTVLSTGIYATYTMLYMTASLG